MLICKGLSKERIAVVRGGNVCFLDATGADPADEVEDAAGLVVGAGRAGAAEGLATHHRACRLVVDVEVAGAMAQDVIGLDDGVAVAGDDGAGECVRGSLVADVQHLLVLVVLIDIHREDRSEDLLADGLVIRGLGQDDGGLHEITDGLVVVTAEYDFCILGGFCTVDVTGDVVEGLFIDDSVNEVGEVADIAHLHRLHHIFNMLQRFIPNGFRHVGAGSGGALLTLVLESTTKDSDGQFAGRSGLVGEDEILATRLTHNLRISIVDVDVLTDEFPEALESAGAAGEVDTRQMR